MSNLHKVIELDAAAARFLLSPECSDLRRRGASVQRIYLPSCPGGGILAGELSHFPVLTVFQVIEISKKTGVLEVVDAKGSGRIWVLDGQICDAEMSYLAQGTAEKALLRMAVSEMGYFAFSAQPPRIRKEIQRLSTGHWGMEAMRVFDESQRLLKTEGFTLLSRIERSITSDSLHVQDPDFYDAALRTGSVTALLDAWPQTDLETLERLVSLLREGHVIIKPIQSLM